MGAHRGCGRTTLAEAPGYRIDRSDCGMLHVHAGPVTLHMDESACESFTTVLARAMVELAQRRRQENRPPLRVVSALPGPSEA